MSDPSPSFFGQQASLAVASCKNGWQEFGVVLDHSDPNLRRFARRSDLAQIYARRARAVGGGCYRGRCVA